MRKLKFVGFWPEELEKLITHLAATDYDLDEITRLRKAADIKVKDDLSEIVG